MNNPDAVSTSVNGISANGRLAGSYADTRLHAYFWSKGVFTTLDQPGWSESQGGFLNAKGEVVGGYRDVNGRRHAFIWRKGVFTTIDPPDSLLATLGPVALGINDPGQVVGTYVDKDGNRHGFLLSKGVYTRLDVPGAVLTVAQGINNAGQIVGLYVDGDGNQHGFVLSKGVFTFPVDVDLPRATPGTTSIFSINAKGEIVGAYSDADGDHGFLGTPIR